MRNLSLAVLPILLFWGSGMHAQVVQDTSAIGGTDEESAYEEAMPAAREISSANAEWDINDSLVRIPGYEVYCGWNTSSIFAHHDREELLGAPKRLTISTAACDNAMPVCGGINSPFGPRRGRMHYGVDLDLETGDPVVSAFEGMVRISRYNKSFGNVIVIRHANGLETLYGHLSRRLLQVGDIVQAGDTIGLGGSTGRSTGSHLHFEVRYLGRPIDPSRIFDLRTGELLSSVVDLRRAMDLDTRAAFHVVRPGDTLSAIARRYGTTVGRLCQLNRMSSRSTLRIGTHLRWR
ncbi:MAG: peptidoglycan DD-metalloendopeptidase family protein [Flavobacteriales bacterium]|nr:peptidoglycan DD-metalloendopeptidase family protein [Flavobacteriales bacterium]MCB9166428.1 peptidoglycan DD-metalloendopeptidase family protein [Flavobacteriales bacterium]